MPNVQLKARVKDLTDVFCRAKDLVGSEGIVLQQRETFYNAPNGKYKMRTVEEAGKVKTELIWYKRPDEAGPKIVDSNRFNVPEDVFEALRTSLEAAMGIQGEVRKTRTVFWLGPHAINVDQVEGLGDFMTLEVVLNSEEPTSVGEETANDIRKKLGIEEADLLTGAYMDMLDKK